MTDQEYKKVEKLKTAFTKLLCNCVDMFGNPKKPTAKQLRKANDSLNEYTGHSSYFKVKETK